MIDKNQFMGILNPKESKGISIDSYLRDTEQFCAYIEESGITGIDQFSVTDINRTVNTCIKKGLQRSAFRESWHPSSGFLNFCVNADKPGVIPPTESISENEPKRKPEY
jgi:site-specific recombinase XerD